MSDLDQAIDEAYLIKRGRPALNGAGLMNTQLNMRGSGHHVSVRKQAQHAHHKVSHNARKTAAQAKTAVSAALEQLKSM